jgi:hypothetical protein
VNTPIINLIQSYFKFVPIQSLLCVTPPPPPPFQHWHHSLLPLPTAMNVRNDLATIKATSITELKFASLLRSHIPPYNTTAASFYIRAKLRFIKYVNCNSKVSIAAMSVYASVHVSKTCPVQTTVFSLLTPSVSALRATSIFTTRSRLSPWQIPRGGLTFTLFYKTSP